MLQLGEVPVFCCCLWTVCRSFKFLNLFFIWITDLGWLCLSTNSLTFNLAVGCLNVSISFYKWFQEFTCMVACCLDQLSLLQVFLLSTFFSSLLSGMLLLLLLVLLLAYIWHVIIYSHIHCPSIKIWGRNKWKCAFKMFNTVCNIPCIYLFSQINLLLSANMVIICFNEIIQKFHSVYFHYLIDLAYLKHN